MLPPPETSAFEVLDTATGRPLRLALQELWLTGRLLPVGAELSVRHWFRSAESHPVEVVYAFALPRDAALRRFRMWGEEFSVTSDLRPTEEAEGIYERALAEGRLTSLARHFRDGVVNLAVGNLQPAEAVYIELELLAGVDLRDDGWRFRFPFTLAPRYHQKARAIECQPGVGEMQLPEEFGGVILPPWLRDAQNLHRVGFELRVPLPAPLREISSPSHRIVVRHEADPEAVVRLATDADLPNRDLVLEVKFRQPLQGLVGGAADTGPGGFAVMIPSAQFGEVPPQSRRVVFVLDRSGSMEGAPLEQARRAVEACLGACSEEDAFSLVAFDHTVMSFSPHLLPASLGARDQARQWLANLYAGGGTELLAGVRAAADVLGPEGGDLLVLTDGQVAGTEDILEALPRSRVRLHCLGIGSASQDRFLSQLTRETGGQCRFLTPRERVDLAVLELFAHLAAPLAWNLRLHLNGAFTASSVRLVGAPPPYVYAGAPLVVQGETDAPAQVTLHLEWEAPTGPHQLELPLDLPTDSAAGTVWLLQGARRITDAESRLSAADLPPHLDQRRRKQWQCLAALSAHYGLASQAMALVAVVQRRSDRPGELPHTLVVPVGMPEDTAFSAYFLEAPPPPGIMHLSYQAPLGPTHPIEVSGVQYDAEESLAKPAPSQRVRETSPGGLDLDLVLALATRIEADGGLPGPDAEQRWLASALAVLCFQAAAADLAVSAFEPHLQHLLRFLRGSPLTRTDPRKAAWLARAERGEIQLRDPWAWLRRLLRDERISPAEFWAAF